MNTLTLLKLSRILGLKLGYAGSLELRDYLFSKPNVFPCNVSQKRSTLFVAGDGGSREGRRHAVDGEHFGEGGGGSQARGNKLDGRRCRLGVEGIVGCASRSEI